MRRIWCAVVVVVALAFSAPPAGAEEVTVQQNDISSLASFLPDDGGVCTGVPDAIPGVFDFADPCTAHDACYAGDQTQAECDQAFLGDMTAACVTQHPDALDPGRYVCLVFAQLYFTGVRVFGSFFF